MLSASQQEALKDLKGRVLTTPGMGNGNDADTFGEEVFGAVRKGEEGITSVEMKDIARAFVNLPGSAIENIKVMGEAILNPMDTIKGIVTVATGAAHRLSGDDTTEAKAFDTVVDELKKRYGSNLRQTLVEDPAGVLLDLSGLLGAPAVGQAARVAQKANPIRWLKGVASKASHAPEEVLPQVLSLTSGMDPVPIHEVYRAGRMGDNAVDAVKAGLREGVDADALRETTVGALKEYDARASRRYDKDWDKVANKDVDLRNIKADILDEVESRWGDVVQHENGKWGIRKTKKAALTPTDERLLNDAIDKVVHWSGGDMKSVDVLRQEIGNILRRASSSKNTARSSRALQDISERLKREWTDEAAEVKGRYAKNAEFSRQAQASLSMSSANPESLLNKLIGSMRDREGLNKRRAIISELEQIADQHITAAAAGSALSQWLPTGIHARAILLSLGGTYVSPWLWLSVPFTSPRVVGEFMRVLGTTEKGVKNLTRFVEKVHQIAPPGANLEGLNLATAVERLLEQGIPVPPPPDVPMKSKAQQRLQGLVK